MPISETISGARSAIRAARRHAERDWPASEAALSALRISESRKPLDFPREAIEFFYDMCRPLAVQVTGDVGEPGPRMKQALKMVAEQPSIPMKTCMEVALWADELRGRFEALAHSPDDLAIHFAISSSLGPKGRTMFNLARAVRPTSILELGTAYAVSATFMMRAQEACGIRPSLTTVEGFSPQKEISKERLSSHFPDASNAIHGLKASTLPEIALSSARFDLFFHDGGHVGDEYLADFLTLEPTLVSGAFIIYDDIRYDRNPIPSKLSCFEGWKEVCRHPRVLCARELDLNIGVIELK